MKRIFPVLFIIAIAMLVIVPAAAVGGDTGYYDIDSVPEGAAVTVDGTPAGTTPVTVPVYTTGTPGHSIVITKTGYETWSQYYAGNPAAGEYISVSAVLVAVPSTPLPGSQKGYYRISSNPSGASVVFDGTSYGTTPVTVSVSTTGTPGHTITVSKNGYEDWSQYYPGNPSADQTISVSAVLTPVVQTGAIAVSSNPSGASAVLDNGYDQLTTPGTFTSVSSGWHQVQVSKSGYQPYSVSIQVKPGQTSTVNAVLPPNQQVGSISVTSSPTGASLYVDTVYQGLTNQIVGNLATGPHTVTLKKSGYQDLSEPVTVYSGQTAVMSVTLTPLISPSTGNIDVSSTPSGASVFVNNLYYGETRASGPLYITGLSPGIYTVLLKKSGFRDYTTAVQVAAGTTAQVAAALQPSSATPAAASVEIYSQPSGADVFINNAYKGVTPLSFDNIPTDATKTYTVEVRMTGYTPYTVSGVLNPGQDVVINAALTPLSVPTTKTPLSPVPVITALAVITLMSGALGKKR